MVTVSVMLNSMAVVEAGAEAEAPDPLRFNIV
jgi:hypothetical protein